MILNIREQRSRSACTQQSEVEPAAYLLARTMQEMMAYQMQTKKRSF